MSEPNTWTPERLSVVSWVLYDLANTIFVLGVVSRYFGVWVVEDQGGRDWHVSLAVNLAMIVVIVVAPWMGARSDHFGRRRPYLVANTIMTVAATATLASFGVVASLAAFVVGQIGLNLGSIAYDAMLPDVSTTETRGRVSGIGVAVGYVGSFIAVGTGLLLLEPYGYAVLFRTQAALFLLFAFPAFFFIRERPRNVLGGAPPALSQTLQRLRAAWRRTRQYEGVTRFLVARFFYTDAMNTVFIFVAIFARTEMDFTDRETDLLTIIGIVMALIGALTAGRLTDLLGPRKTLHGALYLWMIGIALAVVIGVTGATEFGWLIGAIGGAGLGATAATDRVYMTRISPPRHLGEFYGLYAVVGRFATLFGPLAWALIADGLGFGRVAAIGSLLLFFAAGRIILNKVSDHPRQWATGDLDSFA
ncbi:MAG TPA: MFS transporter [Acidimicrobiia bacterium]|nr:MFS transporter [Acidimicrobiia bacterium]